MSKEAEIHFELYRHLANAIDNGASHHGITYTDVDPERSLEGGYADLVVETEGGHPFLVIEAKREPVEDPDRDIDPYATPVIDQASRYAVRLGAPYFATYNGQKLVLFQTFEQGVHLLDRKSREYEVEDISEFAGALLREVAGVDNDEIEWDPHSDTFVSRLDSFHSLLQDEFRESLDSKLEDDSFVSEYEEWIGQQGWTEDYEEDPEEVHTAYTSQASYLFMNKLVFLKLLEDADAYVDVPDVDISDLTDPEARREAFDQLMENVDFKAVYEQEEIFDSLPLSEKAQEEVDSLTDELESYDLDDQFDYDVIGQIYKEIIPAEERHDLGQYYTPPRVVDLITRLTIEEESDDVLDPACGSGGFLVGAYDRLHGLGANDHEDILSQVHGVDINRFPAHLSAINLAVQDLSTETHNTNIEVTDFFNVIPGQDRVTVERASVGEDDDEDDSYEVDFPPTVDAVVANPPYIRAGQIDDTQKARSHLDSLGYDLDGNSDIYCYFFTHSYEFLEDNGKMGFLTSNRWLSANYGENLQEFLFDNFKIQSIIDFQQQMFEIPLISTCITILEKCDDPEERRDNRTNLVHIKDRFDDLEELVDVVRDDEQEFGTMNIESGFRRATFRQDTLSEIERWDRYLFGPKVYFQLLSEYEGEFCTLGDLADVSRGFTSGNNSYFYFQEREEYQEWGIEEEFISPLLKHISPTEYIDLRDEDPTWYYLDLSDYVEEVLDQQTGFEDRDDADVVKNQLRQDGYDGVLSYINHGENQDINDPEESPTVAQKGSVWFDIGDPTIPEIILAKEYWRDSRVLRNSTGTALDQRNYPVEPHEDVDSLVLLGVLNSSLTAMTREMEGQEQQGQAINRNELQVNDAEDMHVPDLRDFSDEDADTIRSLISDWMDRERDGSEQDYEEFQYNLDKAVLSAFGVSYVENDDGEEVLDKELLEQKVDEIQEAVEDLVGRREKGAGLETEVLIGEERQDEDEDDEDKFDLPGATRISDGGQSSISDW
jgi:type I restriction-modification system DNA methylase subunit